MEVGASPRAALHGLAVQDLDRASGPGVDLVVYHVLKPLVVGGAHKYLRRQLPARETVVQDLKKIKTNQIQDKEPSQPGTGPLGRESGVGGQGPGVKV